MFRQCFAIFLFVVLAGFGATDSARGQEHGFVAVNPPQPMPAFVFEDEKGRTLDLKDFRGRYVLLNLWSTSCAPCVAEMPALNDLSKKLGGGKFAVIALAEDDSRDVARLFYDRHRIDHLPVYSDPSGRAPFILHTRGFPTTLFIDPKGAEIARLEGSTDWTKETMVSFIQTRMQP